MQLGESRGGGSRRCRPGLKLRRPHLGGGLHSSGRPGALGVDSVPPAQVTGRGASPPGDPVRTATRLRMAQGVATLCCPLGWEGVHTGPCRGTLACRPHGASELQEPTDGRVQLPSHPLRLGLTIWRTRSPGVCIYFYCMLFPRPSQLEPAGRSTQHSQERVRGSRPRGSPRPPGGASWAAGSRRARARWVPGDIWTRIPTRASPAPWSSALQLDFSSRNRIPSSPRHPPSLPRSLPGPRDLFCFLLSLLFSGKEMCFHFYPQTSLKPVSSLRLGRGDAWHT